MTESESSISLLRDIRDELRTTRTDLTAGLNGVRAEVHELRDEQRITNERLAAVEHTVADAAAQIVFLGRYVKNNHDRAIQDLQRRVSRLEAADE